MESRLDTVPTRAARRALTTAALVWSCGGGPAATPTPTTPTTPAQPPAERVAAGASPGKAAEADRPAAPAEPRQAAAPVTREMIVAYRKHLSAGRKLAASKRWGEAAAEFEAALRSIPMDGRALSELAWAALQAGDYAAAAKAGADAVRVTSEPKLKAASLYNLGRATEAMGDAAGAARLYSQSLSLRPNKTVADRLARLGHKPPAAGAPIEAPPCSEPADRQSSSEELCPCLAARAEDPDDAFDVTCELVDDLTTPDNAAIARVDRAYNEHDFYLLVEEQNKGWTVAAELAHLYDGGSLGVSNDLSWEKLEERKLGKARLLWIEWGEGGQDHDAGINESESHSTRVLALCPLDGPRIPRPRCALTVPLSWEYDRDILIENEEGELTEEEKKLHTPGLPIRDERKLDVQLREDGTVTVKLVTGKADEQVKALLGNHKLF